QVPVVEAAGAGAAVAELVEGDASLGDEAADESFGGAEPVGDLGDRQQRGHEGSHLLVRRWPAWRGRGGGGRGRGPQRRWRAGARWRYASRFPHNSRSPGPRRPDRSRSGPRRPRADGWASGRGGCIRRGRGAGRSWWWSSGVIGWTSGRQSRAGAPR